MGYNTNYTLEHDIPEDSLQEVREQFDVFHVGFIFESGGLEALSWYEHEEHMVRISAQCPEFTFTLTGIGEDPGDMWKKRFRDGVVEEVRAGIVWPEFEELV